MTEDQSDLYARISHSRTADEVVRQIELLILEGVLRDGDRLPGERDLSKRLDVSRPILREALKELETRGLLDSRHGGGTFVADVVGQIFSKPLIELIGRHHKATQDYLEYRRELEGLTAELAATRATDFDRDLLTRVIERMREAHRSGNFDDELEADVELHNAIGESAHNIILLHTLRACYRLLTQGIFFHRSSVFGAPGARDRLLSQHEAIYAAIMARDPMAAKAAAQSHIDFVAAAAREAERSGEWARIARLRLKQRDGAAS
ncbi:FadR/GntR family transcriptional regulator [Sinorhizobium fredii]|uniref:FadR/GntR family transcriptional regulator n=1 Tax=Rhizobium fredii TaxID=380 RepID=UPI0005956C17|nr:FadR/GntR family transcriptional regulator [Sinorhizobium fredii]WOS63466.1 FadR/GntR family transcriptional regulator [Sinorhizobium fredii GR64]